MSRTIKKQNKARHANMSPYKRNNKTSYIEYDTCSSKLFVKEEYL